MEIKTYREGHVYMETLTRCGCCRLVEGLEEVFTYVELIYEDGSRRYVYDNEEGRAFFFTDFTKYRFTSFHEFFTTEEIAYEERGGFPLKYYVPHPDSAYDIASVSETLEKLADVPKLPNRETILTKYDRKVNYHED